MKYDLKNVFDPDLPKSVNDFFNYLDTIKGKSKNTIDGYKVDLTMFFRFLKLYKGIANKTDTFEQIKINDIDNKFIRDISLQDLYAFIAFAESI